MAHDRPERIDVDHEPADMQLTDLEPSLQSEVALQDSKEAGVSTNLKVTVPQSPPNSQVSYRLYKRRFSGLLGFVSLSH
jgi:hypothetical protein